MDERVGNQGWQFDRFVRELLSRLPGITDLLINRDAPGSSDIAVDFVAKFEGRPLLVEAKSQTPQTTRRLQQVVDQIHAAWGEYQQHVVQSAIPPRLVVAFPGVLSPHREATAHAAGIEVWDGPMLQRMARAAGVPAPEFLAIPEEDEAPTPREPADDLLRRLPAIPTGKTGWQNFERFAEDLLNLLFSPPLSPVVTQSSTENGVNRRDFIMPNYATDGFWSFLRLHYRADFVVAEAKNYTKQIGKNEVLQLANYLTHHGTGLTGILLTRTGMAQDARWTSREQWILHNKLVVGLSDEDYKQMLLTTRAGGDPADLVRQRIEDFRLRI